MQRGALDLAVVVLSLTLLFTSTACHSEQTKSIVSVTEPCGFLSSSDIESVQGEMVTAAKGDKRTSGPFTVLQCFYTLPTYSKSVSLDVMEADSDARTAGEFWDRRFHNGGPETDEVEAQPVGKLGKVNAGSADAEKETSTSRPVPVTGLGDEAFWTGSQINGSLYIRHGNDIIRLSIGGPEDESLKLEKASVLGERVISKL